MRHPVGRSVLLYNAPSVQRFLASLGPFAPFAVFLLAAGESAAFLGLVVPGEVAVILGGVVAGTGAVSVWWMATAAVLGAIVGDSIGYELGRKLGPAMLDRPRFQKLATHLDSASALVGERGWWALVVARFTALLRALVPFAAGMGRMPYPRFLFGNALGGIAWGITFTMVGYAAGANYPRVERWFRTGGLILVGLLVVVGGIVWLTRWVARHQAAVLRRLNPVLELRPVQFLLRHAAAPGRGRTLALSGAAIAALLWVFGSLVQDVLGRDEFFFFDRATLEYLHTHQIAAAVDIAAVLNRWTQPPILFAIAAAAGAVAIMRRRPRIAIALGVAAAGQWAIIEGVEALVPRAVPPFEPLAARLGYGFPSEHVAAAAAVLFLLAWPWNRTGWANSVRRFGAVAVVVALIASSRVILLIEYPSDVLAAAVVATAWALLVALAFDPDTGIRRNPPARDASLASPVEPGDSTRVEGA